MKLSSLTIVFVVLKLGGAISWEWIWVISPLWLECCLTLLNVCGVSIKQAVIK